MTLSLRRAAVAGLVALSMVLAAARPANAQTTFSYRFFSCASGVSMQIVFPVTSVLGPVTSGPAGSHSYIYTALSATFSLTINGATQVFNGLSAASAAYAPSTGPLAPALTTVGFDPAKGQGGPPWTVFLQGGGDLLPAGLTPALPPLSTWALPNVPANVAMSHDYIQVGSQFYYIDSFNGCTSSSPGAKALGDPGNLPGFCFCGHPISVGNGNLFEQVSDYLTFGRNQLGFTRYYNSMGASNTFATTLGEKWRSNYDRYLRIDSASSVMAERGDGQQVSFTLTNGAWATDTDVDLKLTNSGTTWTLTDAQDSVETYNATAGATEAVLQSIRGRNGYAQNLQYGAGNQLTTVTDSYNRQLSFAYSGGKLQTVTTPDGLILTYGYTGPLLTSVGYSTSPPTSLTYLYENTALPSALTGIVDENGNRYVTWTYDSAGRTLSSQLGASAELTKVAYNDTDGSRTVTNPLSVQEVYKFTMLQGVPKVTEADRLASASVAAATRKFTYDSNGYTASQTDWNGSLTNFVNDSHGRPTTVNEAVGSPQTRTTTITYHATFHLPLKVVTPGLTTSFTYDNNGELLTKTLTDTTTTTVPYSTSAQTRTWTYTWSNSLLASIKTPRTDVNGLTRFTYDASGALTATTNALGQTTQITQHLPGGLPQTSVDANGVTTSLTYDPRLRLLSSTVATAAGPLATTYSYDAAGNRLSITLPDGSAVTNAYDAAHRLIGIADVFNQSVAYTLDAQGDRTQIKVADSSGVLQRTHSGKFDALGRVQQDIGGVGQTTSYVYDSNGNALTVTDPLSHATHRAFDAFNRVIAVTDAAGGVTRTSYDAHDRPVSVTDPNGGVTTYLYDGFGDVIQRVSPDSGTTVYRYDLDGNLTQRVDGAGATTNYTYDALDRVETVSYPADAAENVAYTYDQGNFGIGRLMAVTDAAGTLARSYDERGNVLSETRVNSAATLVTAYTYDAASRVASITYPSGWVVAYTRDSMGRATAATAQAPDGGASVPVLANAGYQPFGPINALTFGNGVTETNNFDLDYRLTGLADTGMGALLNLTYAYDAANNVSSITDGVVAGNSQSLGYDALDRLIKAAGAYGAFGYSYDGVGNRLTQSFGGSATTYSYAAHSNQLAGVSASGAQQAIGYNKAGNANNFNPAAGAITNAIYNQAGRLATVMAGSNLTAQYTYDAFGQRLSRVGAVTATTLYQYDQSSHLLEETDGQGNPLADYIYLGDLPVATISPGDGQVYFLHSDRLGTPQAATDSNQNVVWSASYGPFGEMSTVPAGIVQDLRLPGQEFDVETGLYHNGFRDYAPGWGRYLQSDPIGLAGGLNTYGYVGGNPIKSIDPLGLCTLSQDWCAFKQNFASEFGSGNDRIAQAFKARIALSLSLESGAVIESTWGSKSIFSALKWILKPGGFGYQGSTVVGELFPKLVTAGANLLDGAAVTAAAFGAGLEGGNAIVSAIAAGYDVSQLGAFGTNCPQ